jgi:hypothetical protein
MVRYFRTTRVPNRLILLVNGIMLTDRRENPLLPGFGNAQARNYFT